MLHRLPRILAAVLLLLTSAAAVAEERVRIAAEPGSGADALDAVLFLPAGKGPFPAVVALHGCGGPWDKAGRLEARGTDWAKLLTSAGYAVIFPDSFGSRGAVGSQCSVAERVVRQSVERVADARATLAYLQGRPDIRGDAVALLGWSNGGGTVLYASRLKSGPKTAAPDFRAAFAFYPGCKTPLESATWASRLPLMILNGAADDWTPAAPCAALAELHADRVRIVTYPGAYHDFDHPSLPVHVVKGVAFSGDGSGVVHTGTDGPARQDAQKRVLAELAKALK